jgi:hypothetical protein
VNSFHLFKPAALAARRLCFRRRRPRPITKADLQASKTRIGADNKADKALHARRWPPMPRTNAWKKPEQGEGCARGAGDSFNGQAGSSHKVLNREGRIYLCVAKEKVR